MNDYVHIEAADLRRPNARFTTERQGYQVLTPFGKLGYSQKIRSKWSLSPCKLYFVFNFLPCHELRQEFCKYLPGLGMSIN